MNFLGHDRRDRQALQTILPNVSQSPGSGLLAVAVLALGVMNLVRGDFTVIFHPMPDGLPARPMLAAIANGTLAAAGIAILFGRAWPAAALVLAVDFAALSTGWMLRVLGFPAMIGTWLGLAEQIALALGALAIFARAQPTPTRLAAICRIGFGLCEIVFALAHFLSLAETVAMTPAYLPFGARFWALATGVAHLAAGILLIAGAWPTIVTRALALMFTSFGLMVWLPRVIGTPTASAAWAGNLINLALIGAVLAVGEASRRSRAHAAPQPAHVGAAALGATSG